MDVKFEWNGDKVTRAAREAMKKAAHEAMEAVLAETIPVTPKDEGNLRNSGHVVPASANQVGTEVKVVFDTPYAVPIHEGYRVDPRTGKIVQFRNFQEPGTGPKFLENTFNQMKDRVLEQIGEAVQEALRK